ncbi:MAG: hypothetical protein ACREEW_05660 [Caulobacteraceae bacterium]
MTCASPAGCRRADNAYLTAACLALLVEAGAAAPCPMGHARYVRAFDNAAEVRAFAKAALAQSGGDLNPYRLDHVVARLTRLLDGMEAACPECAHPSPLAGEGVGEADG